jgi:hypothetical protein
MKMSYVTIINDFYLVGRTAGFSKTLTTCSVAHKKRFQNFI